MPKTRHPSEAWPAPVEDHALLRRAIEVKDLDSNDVRFHRFPLFRLFALRIKD